ncbi:unnamed protein product, partial [Amoebophrya sp. A25]
LDLDLHNARILRLLEQEASDSRDADDSDLRTKKIREEIDKAWREAVVKLASRTFVQGKASTPASCLKSRGIVLLSMLTDIAESKDLLQKSSAILEDAVSVGRTAPGACASTTSSSSNSTTRITS